MLSLAAESWMLYGIACVVLICRYVSRWLQLGSVSRYQIEDYIMISVFGFYTTLLVTMNIVVHYPTNFIQPKDVPNLTPELVTARIYGSKIVVIVEQTMIMTIWGCKLSLLYFYHKLTFGLVQEWAVKIVAAYTCITWLLMEVLYFLVWCRPFTEYWAVPTDNIQCTAATHHLLTNFIFNVSSDLFIMCIPLPLLIRSKLPLAKKLMLCLLFSLGIFVILCAVLNKYNSFKHYNNAMWTYWYIRETSTAVYTANVPMCWALVRRIFNVRAFNSPDRNGIARLPETPNIDDIPATIGGGEFRKTNNNPAGY
ncbi:hypothetical protein DL95DRAFT_316042 [Leptodontidium sp. 2 PMI_412]|nr:hypothetical protein BKA61DRAFT_547369 [Leptodontidium sp. MPI-SDFR-AT-0119]KAH9206207.1 hypothetical protein DL95DRAFT_316042 [Leptodontidium sp. 2 PMI_412]